MKIKTDNRFQQLLNSAKKALQSGDEIKTRQFAESLLSEFPQSEEGWLVMAVVSQPGNALAQLENALRINPDSDAARQAIRLVTSKMLRDYTLAPKKPPLKDTQPIKIGEEKKSIEKEENDFGDAYRIELNSISMEIDLPDKDPASIEVKQKTEIGTEIADTSLSAQEPPNFQESTIPQKEKGNEVGQSLEDELTSNNNITGEVSISEASEIAIEQPISVGENQETEIISGASNVIQSEVEPPNFQESIIPQEDDVNKGSQSQEDKFTSNEIIAEENSIAAVTEISDEEPASIEVKKVTNTTIEFSETSQITEEPPIFQKSIIPEKEKADKEGKFLEMESSDEEPRQPKFIGFRIIKKPQAKSTRAEPGDEAALISSSRKKPSNQRSLINMDLLELVIIAFASLLLPLILVLFFNLRK